MKKIIVFVFCICYFFANNMGVFAERIEDVFSDITADYPYYHELQSLYNKGMFSPDKDGNFNPDMYLTREEFIGVVSEVSCKKCIKPNVGPEYFQKYYNYDSFFDIEKNGKYSYCIAGAKDTNIISGYAQGHKCENGKSKAGESPFCPSNKIVLEEGLAILLRSSGILTAQQAENIRKDIREGKEYPVLANDVQASNNGYVYSFYPDFYKALNIKITEYDTQGNKKIYTLLEKTGNSLFPQKALTKEEFLKMAYVAMKGNSCVEGDTNSIGANIQIFDKECSAQKLQTCRVSRLNKKEKIYDLHAKIATQYSSSDMQFTWRIYDFSDGTEVVHSGKYIDDYDFQENGKYRMYLVVSDGKGNYSEVYNDIIIGVGVLPELGFINDLKTSIAANPLSGSGPLKVDFSGIVSNGSGITDYSWDFGDGTNSKGINTSHTFKDDGSYTVVFSVTDDRGKTSKVSTVIEVSNQRDTDGDGVKDSDDYEQRTPEDKILFICTKIDIEARLYGCGETDLGVYSPDKATTLRDTDTDGDGVKDYLDKEKNTDPDKVDTICTKADIDFSRFGCTLGDLGVANPKNTDSTIPDLGIQINVYDSSCTRGERNCEKPRFPEGVTIFDFSGETSLLPSQEEGVTYTWTITNTGTGVSETISQDYLDNYYFLEAGEYEITLTVTTVTGDTATAKTHISIGDIGQNNIQNLSIAIDANPLKTRPGSGIDFSALISTSLDSEDIDVTWDFGDRNTDTGRSTSHVYTYEGTYVVIAEVLNKSGDKQIAEVVVYITNDIDDTDGDGIIDLEDNQKDTPTSQVDSICTKEDIRQKRYGCGEDDLGVYNPEKDTELDSDNDGIPDSTDQCPNIPGKQKNLGCPIYELECSENTDCPSGHYCDGEYCQLQIIASSCEFRGLNVFLGNVVCNSCPCDYGIDFRATTRSCDIIFPAITSLDEKNIFSKGRYFQIERR